MSRGRDEASGLLAAYLLKGASANRTSLELSSRRLDDGGRGLRRARLSGLSPHVAKRPELLRAVRPRNEVAL